MNCENAMSKHLLEKVDLLERKVDFLARTIKGCPTFHGYYKNCKGECQKGGKNMMSKCWKEIATKAAQL